MKNELIFSNEQERIFNWVNDFNRNCKQAQDILDKIKFDKEKSAQDILNEII